MSQPPGLPGPPTDREMLSACRRQPGAESFQRLLRHYLPLVHATIRRRSEDPAAVEEIVQAVFLTTARRARRLGLRTVLADWLHQVTLLACRKRLGKFKPRWRRSWRFWRRPESVSEEGALRRLVSHDLDMALARLPRKERQALLVTSLLDTDPAWAAPLIGCPPGRVVERSARGLAKLARHFRVRGLAVEAPALGRVLAVEGCAGDRAEGQEAAILQGMADCVRRKPDLKLARRVLASLAWQRWRLRMAIGLPSAFMLLIATAFGLWHIDASTGHSRSLTAFLIWAAKREGETVPGLREPARPWPVAPGAAPDATRVAQAQGIYLTTNIWRAHLHFTPERWEALEPRRISPLPHFFQPDGSVLLRNPEAQRSGLAGVLGFDFQWSRADFTIGGRAFGNVGVRIKGNGTYLSSLATGKRSLKVDVNKFTQGRRWGDIEELNFHNILEDRSCMSDALAYEFFRDAGVPAPRTAYAWLTVTVDGRWTDKPLGLFAMVQPVDEAFLFEWFGSRRIPLFKPVTYELFEDRGRSWTNYTDVYDLKTQATPEQRQRVVDLAQLVSHASDGDFEARLPEFLDLDAFARFLAGTVLLSCYDSILSNGQNYYLYLDPRSNRFGFVPWDMDMAWGAFFLLGSVEQRERASIWHPWVGNNRFMERVMATGSFRQKYRAELESQCQRLFVPDRLNERVDEMAAILREPVSAESGFRLRQFQWAVSSDPAPPAPEGNPQGLNRPVHQLKRFFARRAGSVRRQLDGQSEGVVLERRERR